MPAVLPLCELDNSFPIIELAEQELLVGDDDEAQIADDELLLESDEVLEGGDNGDRCCEWRPFK